MKSGTAARVVHATVDNRIRVPVGAIPEPILDAVLDALEIPNRERELALKHYQFGAEDLPKKIVMYGLRGDTLDMPRGFAEDFKAGLESFGLSLELEDRRTAPRRLKLGGKSIKLRPHQIPAVDSILEHKQGILKGPPGSGKTVSVLEAGRRAGTKCLIVVNTKEIMNQWVDRIHEHLDPNIVVGRIGDNMFSIGGTWTVAIINSLHSKRDDLEEEGFFSSFGLVCLDECFPAGTEVGGIPIEDLSIGDLVPSFDETTGEFVHRRVLHKMVNDVSQLVRIRFSSGQVIVCTPGHPFLVGEEWIPAGKLTSGCMVRYDGTHDSSMQSLRRTCDRGNKIPEGQTSQAGVAVLLEDLRSQVFSGSSKQDNGCDEQEVCVGADESQESDARSSCSGKDVSDLEVDRAQAFSAWRKRYWSDESGKAAWGRAEAVSIRYSNWIRSRGDILSNALQGRFGGPESQAGDRDRWREPRTPFPTGAGPQEGRLPEWSRVDSIEVLEPGSDRQFDGLCPDGKVYNIEVEDTNTYLVDGLVVHNCHHATAETYMGVMDLFTATIRMGASATPKKTGDFTLAQLILGNIFHTTKLEDIPDELDKPVIVKVKTNFNFNFVGTRSRYRRSNYPDLLKALISDPERNRGIVGAIMSEAGHHCLVLTKRHEHIDILIEMLERERYPYPIMRLTGKETSAVREEVVAKIASHPGVTFSTVADEAFDVPRIDRGFLVFPQSNDGLIEQQLGRYMRSHSRKTDSRVYDFVDPKVPPLRKQWTTRLTKVYKKFKLRVINVPIEEYL